jgi:hypothetical protein
MDNSNQKLQKQIGDNINVVIPTSPASIVLFFSSIYAGYTVYKKMGFKGNFIRYLKSRIFSNIIYAGLGVAFSLGYIITGRVIGGNAGNLVALVGTIGSFIYSNYRSYKYLRKQVDTEDAYIKMILTDIINEIIYVDINTRLKFGRSRKLKLSKRRSRSSKYYKLKSKRT